MSVEGDYWTVTFDGRQARVRDSKGMGFLAHLLGRPEAETPALELGGCRGRTPGRVPGARRVCLELRPPHPAFDILRTEIVDAYRRSGKNFNIGRRIARMLREAGLDDVRIRPTARVTQLGNYYQTFLLTIASLVRDVITHGGGLTYEEFDAHAAELQAHHVTAGTATCQPLVWRAWGRVPSIEIT